MDPETLWVLTLVLAVNTDLGWSLGLRKRFLSLDTQFRTMFWFCLSL